MCNITHVDKLQDYIPLHTLSTFFVRCICRKSVDSFKARFPELITIFRSRVGDDELHTCDERNNAFVCLMIPHIISTSHPHSRRHLGFTHKGSPSNLTTRLIDTVIHTDVRLSVCTCRIIVLSPHRRLVMVNNYDRKTFVMKSLEVFFSRTEVKEHKPSTSFEITEHLVRVIPVVNGAKVKLFVLVTGVLEHSSSTMPVSIFVVKDIRTRH